MVNKRFTIFSFFVLAVFLRISLVHSQEVAPEDRIGSAVDAFTTSHKYRIGIFRFRPQIQFRAGVDSNAVFGNLVDENDEYDFFIRALPQISAGLKFGRRGYFRVQETLNMFYYVKQADRRDIFGSTIAEFVTGSPDVLVTIQSGYLKRDDPPDEELDEPITHINKYVGAIVEYSLTHRIDMSHWTRLTDTHFVSPEVDTSLNLTDRRTITFGTGTRYQLKSDLWLTNTVSLNRSEATDSQIIRHYWNFLTGVEVRKLRMEGNAAFGFGVSDEENARHNFLMDGHVDFLFGRRSRVGFFLNRKYEFSSLEANALRVTTQGGARFTRPLSDRFELTGDYTIGKNDYGDQPISGTIVTHDTFQRGILSVGIRTVRAIILRPGIGYISRNTDIPELDKSRFGWLIDVGVGYSINF